MEIRNLKLDRVFDIRRHDIALLIAR